MLLCCGADGLLEYADKWQPRFCPLPSPSLLAAERQTLGVVDNTERLLWLNDVLMPVDSGIESLLLWHGHPLTLSGDTDCVTLMDPIAGDPMVLAPAGVYPQDMCLLPGDVLAVCGGGSGTAILLQLPALTLLKQLRLPGCVQRAAWHDGWLYTLCTVEDDELLCLLCRVQPRSERYEPLCSLPGLSGALYADQRGLWIAAGEGLHHLRWGEARPIRHSGGWGLVRHICGCGQQLILSDPALDALFLLEPGRPVQKLLEDGVGQALFTS